MDLDSCNIYFAENGYYIEGGGVQVYREIRRKTDGSGNPVLDEMHHNYFVLIAVLQELREAGVPGRINIYHDTRIIEDINGVSTLDDFCESAKLHIQRRLLPEIPGMTWFRKCTSEAIRERLEDGRRTMTGHIDVGVRKEEMEKAASKARTAKQTQRKSVIEAFKAEWFGS